MPVREMEWDVELLNDADRVNVVEGDILGVCWVNVRVA